MKRYSVYMVDLALAPLQGQNPQGGRRENFDEIEAAQAFADNEKSNWGLVVIYKRVQEGQLEELEHYLNGRKYKVRNTK